MEGYFSGRGILFWCIFIAIAIWVFHNPTHAGLQIRNLGTAIYVFITTAVGV